MASPVHPSVDKGWPQIWFEADGVERQLRLRRESEVRAARARGRAVAEGPLVIRVLPNASDPPANRYAVVAGRKSGGAVQRNRLKRVIREALRALHPQVRPGYDLVVIARGTVEELPGTREARELLEKLLVRAGLLPWVPNSPERTR